MTLAFFTLIAGCGRVEGGVSPAERDEASVAVDARETGGASVPDATNRACTELPAHPPLVCSAISTTPTSIRFVNDCGRRVAVYWVDYTCGEKFYLSLGPGESYTQSTFVTHPWRLRDETTHALVLDVPANVSPDLSTVYASGHL
jgi:hypothetical protein